MRTDLAQYYNSTKPSTRLTYMTSQDEKVNFEINGTDLLMRDLNIFCSTNANNRAVLEQLKQMALTNNTTGATIFDLGKIVQADSISEVTGTLKAAEEKMNKQKQEEQQHQQEMQQQQLDSQEKQKKMELDAAELRDEKNRQKDILVAEIRASGMGAMTDINENKESDFLDAMKEIRATEEFQDQTNLQREKETNRMNNDSQKAQIEREKIQAQREIADKQLQVAQENKNRFDKPKGKE
jgi:hypothetical protein